MPPAPSWVLPSFKYFIENIAYVYPLDKTCRYYNSYRPIPICHIMWSNIYKPIYIYTHIYIYNSQKILSLDHGWIWVNNLSRPFCQVPEWMWTTGTAVPCRPARPMRHVGDGPLKASTTSRRLRRAVGWDIRWDGWNGGGFDAHILVIWLWK